MKGKKLEEEVEGREERIKRKGRDRLLKEGKKGNRGGNRGANRAVKLKAVRWYIERRECDMAAEHGRDRCCSRTTVQISDSFAH